MRPILIKNGIKSIPVDKDEFAELVFKQEEYKDKKQRVERDSKIA